MNCVELFTAQARENPKKMAVSIPGTNEVTFEELFSLSKQAQSRFLKLGLKSGDKVLLMEALSPELYAHVIALLGIGATVLLVEPWMPIEKIESVIQFTKPKIFLSGALGKIWGLRVKAVRDIPKWISKRDLTGPTQDFVLENVDPKLEGIITFTSGSTGSPKGVVRGQGYLVDQHRVLCRALHLNEYKQPDLCIFANFVFANLASGRGSVIVPPKWKQNQIQFIDALPKDQRPETMTCGPAFLRRLLDLKCTSYLKSIHIGGALSDVPLFEEAVSFWRDAQLSHVYGSTEAEPVAVADIQDVIRESKKAGYFQSLYLGKPIEEIEHSQDEQGLWVTGAHVCPEYVANKEENQKFKRRDTKGRVWHGMGDRIKDQNGSFWFQGRSNQNIEDFKLEQDIYSHLKSSSNFVTQKDAEKILFGENVKNFESELRKRFPQLGRVVEGKIKRDRRHRARIDRAGSLKGYIT